MAYEPSLLDLGTILARNPLMQAQINAIPQNIDQIAQIDLLRQVLAANGIPSYVANRDTAVGIRLDVGTLPALRGIASGSAAYAGLLGEIQSRVVVQSAVAGSPLVGAATPSQGPSKAPWLIGGAVVLGALVLWGSA